MEQSILLFVRTPPNLMLGSIKNSIQIFTLLIVKLKEPSGSAHAVGDEEQSDAKWTKIKVEIK
jgi:hypothetical protein